jgi:hypothetical protein
VVRSFPTAKLKMLVGAALALGFVATATGVLAFQAPGRDDPPLKQAGQQPAGKPSRDDRNWKVLAVARVETARAILDQDMQRLQHTLDGNLLAEIPVWSRRLMEDRLRLATTQAERIAAIREHRDRMRDVERQTDAYAKTGQGRISDALKASYYRLEADQGLVEERVDVGKIVLPALPKSEPMAPRR